MTYDDWKTRSDRDEGEQPMPDWYCDICEHRGAYLDSCGCPCCSEPEDGPQ